MSQSKVYFTNMKANPHDGLQKKLTRLLTGAKMGDIDFKDKFVAIKMHFGEPGNLAFLRHQYAKTVADFVKSKGGKPFLTDCNTLYVGGRKNALDHLDSAYLNGFTIMQTGCHTIIADGIKGTDEVEVPVENGEYIRKAKIGRAIMDADIIISLSHFKCHELAGIGGAIKNIGMGCGSRAGKKEMHSTGKPIVNHDLCIGCGACSRICAHGAPNIENKKATISHDKCAGCGRCIEECPKGAISPSSNNMNSILNKKMVEYTWAVVHGRPQFHISFVVDVSPNCDCHSENDIPIVPNVGMFASCDPTALDKACADIVNAQNINYGSILYGKVKKEDDYFTALYPDCHWQDQISYGEKMGLGSSNYELIEIE